jgi:hypothetical protein
MSANSMKVLLKDGTLIEGTCFCVDVQSSTLVIQIGLSFKMIMGDQIQKIEGEHVNLNTCVNNQAHLLNS